MPPPANSVEREEERRLNTRTLAIASVASASAAAVTSQLWIAGTWVAAALTPVLVAVISEAMHRPTERIARAWTSSERQGRSSRSISPTRTEPTAVTGTPGPVRVYRAGSGGSGSGPGSTMLTRRRVAVGTVAATAAIACVAGLLLLTTADLVSGGSVGKGSGRLTLTGGGGDKKSEQQDQQKDTTQQQKQDSTDQQNSAPSAGQTTTQPAPSDQEPPSDTAPTTPPAETSPEEPVPQDQTP
jgi:hypothetical protein